MKRARKGKGRMPPIEGPNCTTAANVLHASRHTSKHALGQHARYQRCVALLASPCSESGVA